MLKLKNKIFGIGSNKTGTTSLDQIFKDIGLNVPVQQEQEEILFDAIRIGDFYKITNFCDKYDAYQDAPFSLEIFFVVFDVLYPNSKFILTIRDPKDWYQSLINYHKKKFNFVKKRQASESFFKGKNLYLKQDYMYNRQKRVVMDQKSGHVVYDWKMLYNRRFRTKEYNDRNSNVIKYFHDRPNQLLVIDLTKETDTSKIIKFLDLSQSDYTNTTYEQNFLKLFLHKIRIFGKEA